MKTRRRAEVARLLREMEQVAGVYGVPASEFLELLREHAAEIEARFTRGQPPCPRFVGGGAPCALPAGHPDGCYSVIG